MKLSCLLQCCLSSAILLFAIQPQSTAQSLIAGEEANRQSSAPQVRSLMPIAIPNLPQIQPILPDVPADVVRLVLRRGERRVYVYRGEEQLASYPVAVGRPGWETPIGTFEVIQMIEHPGWTNPFTREVVPPGSENPLGDRWIGFWTDGTNYIGFHGTPNRESVGRAASHGCVRLYNEDIRDLYALVTLGTTVTVVP